MHLAKTTPEGYHTVTPYIVVRSAAEAIEFYKKAFGAEELGRMAGPDGHSVMHAEIKIGDSPIMLADENPQWGALSPQSLGGVAGSLHVYVEDVDAAVERAVQAGATLKMPAADMFWGDRFGKVVDPFGQEWSLATHIEDLTNEEIEQRAKEFFARMSLQGRP
ncbi:MAG: VOC family protein [Bryobacteraceae bacterium]|nr:VOC family protein [Bryobacteraceae bacterium]